MHRILLFIAVLCLLPDHSPAAERPNIVVILLDNVGREWFGC